MADIGIIGGSGLYSLLKNTKEVEVDTDYGKPSDSISIGKVGKVEVAFLNRHGKGHTFPPHKVPYLANIEAFRKLGVRWILAWTATGSLDINYKPGDIVLFDQFVNMTYGRRDTFFDGPEVIHTNVADPFCNTLLALAAKKADELGYRCHPKGTVVVINGPRFSSKAESALFVKQGFQTINMTSYPEVVLARERKIHLLGMGLITDYDNGVHLGREIKPLTFDDIKRTFEANVKKVNEMVFKMIPEIMTQKSICDCNQG